jgi:hypothetical protein
MRHSLEGYKKVIDGAVEEPCQKWVSEKSCCPHRRGNDL